MIFNKSDYLFVDFPAATIAIDQEVMPKRYPTPSLRRVLRGLDAAMMIECVGERKNVIGGYSLKTDLTREISGVPFADAASWCRANCGSSSRWRMQAAETQGFWNVGNVDLMSVYARTIPLLQMESDPDDFQPGKPLVADNLMKLYRDMNEFRRFIPPVYPTTISSSNYDISSDSGGGYDPTVNHQIDELSARYSSGGTSMGGTDIYYHEAVNYAGTFFGYCYEFSADLASGTYRAFLPAGANLNLYGQAQGYALIYTSCDRATAGTWYDWVQVTAAKNSADHCYDVSAAQIASAASAARTYHDISVLGMGAVDFSGQTILQRVTALALAVDLTDHTDFSQWIGAGN